MEIFESIRSQITKVYRYTFANDIVCYRLDLTNPKIGSAIIFVNINKSEVQTIFSQNNAFLEVLLPNLQVLLDYALELEAIQKLDTKGFTYVENSRSLN